VLVMAIILMSPTSRDRVAVLESLVTPGSLPLLPAMLIFPMSPLSRPIMAVVVIILVPPLPRAMTPLLLGREMTPPLALVPILGLDRGRQEKNGGQRAA
jgi:hypothetical protein